MTPGLEREIVDRHSHARNVAHLRALGTRTCVVEALECPTLLYNGDGEHNIQGIGDKHVPLTNLGYYT